MDKTMAKAESRKFGVDLVGDIAWGTHFCQFYQTKEDLIDTLVPYFAEGLRNNEFCMWITSPPLEVEEAGRALRKVIPNLDEYIRNGQIEILPYTDWYLIGGQFTASGVLDGWIQKEKNALSRGFAGLRLTGNTFWVDRDNWQSFVDYEATINDVILSRRMIALCTYCLERCTGNDVVDVIKNHRGTLIRKGGTWYVVEDVVQRKKIEESLRETRDYLDSLLNYANAPIIVWDPNFKITRFNHAFERLTGLSSSGVIGKHLDILFPKDKKEEAMSHIRRTLAGEYWETVEIPISNADGTVRTVLWNSANIYDRDGKTVVSTIAQGQDITERKQTEDELRKSQIDLNRAQTVAKIGSWRLDVRCNELLWSDETHRMFGIPTGTPMTYETFLGTIHPDDREYVDQKWKAALRGERYDVEHRIIVNGEVKWVREKAELEFNEDGSLMGGFGTVQDITERKLMEEALAQSEERYRALVELSPDAVAVYREGRFVYVNVAGVKLFGASSPDQIVGKPVLDLVHPDYQEMIANRIQLAEKGTQTPRREARLLRLDGQPVEIEAIGTPITWEGRPAAQVIIRDITERKQAENELRETRDYLDSLLNYANAPIIVWDPQFRITMFNRAFERLTGLSSSDVIGNHLDILFPRDRKGEAMAHIRRTLAGEYWETVEIPILCKDGTVRTALWNSANIYTPDGKGVVATIAQGQDITERKRAEEKMLKEKQFSETIINSLPGVFYALDDAGGFLQINEDFAQVARYSPEEILSKMNVTDFFAEKEKKLIKEKIREVFEKGMATVEANFLSKDGVTTPYYFTGVRIVKDSTPILIGMGINISERIKAEEALRETRDYLDNLLNYANAPIIVWDPQFRITMFNHAFEHLTGLSERDVIGKPLDMLFPKDQKEEALAHIRRTLSGEYWETVEILILRSDGTVRTALWNSANIYDVTGRNVIATIAQGQDITERKKAEEELKRSETRFRTLVEPNIIGIISADLERIIEANDAFLQIVGYDRKDLSAGRIRWREMTPPEYLPLDELALKQMLDSGSCEPYEKEYFRKDGTRVPILIGAAVYQKSPLRWVCFVMDMTERKKLEEKLKETERMAAIGETAAMVGHDLRNPLQAIAGYTSLMRELLRTLPSDDLEKQKLAEFTLRIDDQVRYTDKIISDLRDYTVAIAPARVKTDLRKLISETLSTAGIPENISVSIEIPKSLTTMKVDPLIMRRVLTNLINNAVQAMPNGGKLNVKASRKKKRRTLVMSVEDTGVGIPKKDYPRIFIPLFTTRAKGQGFGLPVCKRLVEAHNGTITFKSQVGKGSKFTIIIPLAENH